MFQFRFAVLLLLFDYDQQRSPAAIGKPFRVDIAIKSAADQEALDPKDLEEKFETVARASIVR